MGLIPRPDVPSSGISDTPNDPIGQGVLNASEWFGDKFGYLQPGYDWVSALDLNGSKAAQAQYEASLALQQQAQAYNSAEADKSRQWQEMMDNSSIQRRVQDIKAAGLNPWLAISGSIAGSGSPSGSSASSSSGSASMANNKFVQAAGLIAMALRLIK